MGWVMVLVLLPNIVVVSVAMMAVMEEVGVAAIANNHL